MIGKKPVIGIAGGIGSGKSLVAKLFGELGGLVISSDEQVREAYELDEVKQALRQWWGDAVFKVDGSVDRRAIAVRVFSDEQALKKLEGLLHPLVIKARDELMKAHEQDAAVTAFVWEVPLLFETGQNARCDAVVFVEAPLEERVRRVREQRGWDAAEVARREKTQWTLDKKREISDYVISNTAGVDAVREQVRAVFSQILSKVQKSDGA